MLLWVAAAALLFGPGAPSADDPAPAPPSSDALDPVEDADAIDPAAPDDSARATAESPPRPGPQAHERATGPRAGEPAPRLGARRGPRARSRSLQRPGESWAVEVTPGRVQRPRQNGFGLFVAAGSLFGIAMGEQFFAFHLVRAHEACLENISARDPTSDTPVLQPGDPAIVCFFAPQVAQIFRNSASVFVAGAVGLVGAGATLRARVDAYDTHFEGLRVRDTRRLVIAGGTTIGIAAAAWLTTRIVLVAAPVCESLKCVITTDAIATDLAGAAGAAGVGMLAYALAYRARLKRHAQMEASLAPQASLRSFGLGITGRF